MNKLKNIGISALAGTLVSLSAAQAGGVSVTGAWELSYTNKHSEKVSGNKLGMKKNITFGSGGDISDGGAVTWATTVAMSDTMGLSSASMSINMGGIATLAYDSGTGGYGANKVDNIVPTAWEEIDYGLSTGITDVGRVSSSKGVVNFAVKAPTSGTGISFSYISRMGGSHIADGGTDPGASGGGRGIDLTIDFVDYSSPHFGFRLGTAAEMEIINSTCDDEAKSAAACNSNYENHPYAGTAYTKLALGPVHIGAQATFEDMGSVAITGEANRRSIVGGIALVFGDTLSLSYGRAYDKIRWNDALRGRPSSQQNSVLGVDDTGVGGETSEGEYTRIDYSGISAALNIGPVALKATRNRVDGAGENHSSQPRKHSELNLSIAF